jgi:hypothetical protein
MTQFHGFDDGMFSNTQKIDFHGFKNGEHKFRILPPFAPGKLFHQVDLHWGFTDEAGKKKALRCTKYSHKTCAICDEVDRLKGEIELLKSKPCATSDEKTENDKMIVDKETRIGDIKKKPTYLWNIVTENGEQKVLQLSWNGHDPLLQKVKFFWEQRKINVTDVNNNYLIFCSRTGLAVKTRYQYEVLEQNIKKLEGLKPLIDLTVVYKESTPAELKAIVEQGFVGIPDADPNDRSFEAMPAGTTAQSALQTTASTQQTTPPPANNTAQQTVQAPPAELSAENKQVVDAEAERLMKMLQG